MGTWWVPTPCPPSPTRTPAAACECMCLVPLGGPSRRPVCRGSGDRAGDRARNGPCVPLPITAFYMFSFTSVHCIFFYFTVSSLSFSKDSWRAVWISSVGPRDALGCSLPLRFRPCA